MLSTYLLLIFVFLFMAAIMMHPAICVSGAAAGLMTWFNSVIPSLFPFMVLTGLLLRSGTLTALTEKCKSGKLIRQLPITELFAVLTGILCGYPMGIRTVSELKAGGQLSGKRVSCLYTFVNQPGPMFILGYALPLTNVPEVNARIWLISFYGAVLLTAVLSYLYFRIRFVCFRKRTLSQNKVLRTDTLPSHNGSPENTIKTGASSLSLFEDILMTSAATLTKIGGYMILFSMTAALLGELLPNFPLIRLLFCGLLEMTSGTALAKGYGSLSPYLVLGFISFGGLSVAAQSFTLGNLSVREQYSYLFWKSIQAILSVTLYKFFICIMYG